MNQLMKLVKQRWCDGLGGGWVCGRSERLGAGRALSICVGERHTVSLRVYGYQVRRQVLLSVRGVLSIGERCDLFYVY